MTARRLVIGLLLLALLFAVQGGEYSTWDFLTLRGQERDEKARITALESEVDSLKREAVAVEQDPEVQERLARELYGMIREGEFVYNLLWEEEGRSAGTRERRP